MIFDQLPDETIVHPGHGLPTILDMNACSSQSGANEPGNGRAVTTSSRKADAAANVDRVHWAFKAERSSASHLADKFTEGMT